MSQTHEYEAGSFPLTASSSSSSSSSSTSQLYNDKSYHLTNQYEREHDVEEGVDTKYELDSDDQNESHPFLPFQLPWTRRHSSGSTSSTDSETGGRSWLNLKGKRNGTGRSIVLSLGATFVLFGLLVLGYLILGESIPDLASDDVTIPHSQITYTDNDTTPQWKIDASTIPSDSTHVVFPAHTPPKIHMLEPLQDRLPYPVLESYFSKGTLPRTLTKKTAPAQIPLDLVYLFVNASSPYLQEAMKDRAEVEGLNLGGGARHWRDNGELRGAIRSATQSLGGEAGKIHVITADWALKEENGTELGLSTIDRQNKQGKMVKRDGSQHEGDWRIGQVTEWLDWQSQTNGSRLKWHFHSDLFQLPKDEHDSTSLAVEQEWKDEALPTFNSFSIESRLAWIDGLSENFIAFNDDMFLLRPLSISDFRHPLLGNLVRLDPSLLVPPMMSSISQISDPGEWGALQHANQLLSARFPLRKRMYMHHLPKTQSRTLAHEASIMWEKELTLASTRGFRESKKGEGDVEMAWLITHLRVERWREALLWSWVVGKIGGVEGVWGKQAKKDLRKVLGMDWNQEEGEVKVYSALSDRKTLEDLDGLMNQAGWESPKASVYKFSSMDGHLPHQFDESEPDKTCAFDLSTCLPGGFLNSSKTSSASDMFKHLAFAQPQCEDCLIRALVKASGARGLDAFLPSSKQVFYPPEEHGDEKWRRTEPILPLVSSWSEGDFSLAANVRKGQDVWEGTEARADGGVELRRWCIKLLSRYNYVWAETPSRFSPIHSTTQLSMALNQVEHTPELAMLCLNDDQSAKASEGARNKLGEWMEQRWGGEIDGVDWERVDVPWT
ncbi:hypothetical protein CI109_106051 [Kwoniella shandongensis]|uniref:Uncharacterized protein n=1 Tax=Kwoniella shandongensis TaxID=1734106 RepID=A0A5M6BXQ6_9TREE|nr:uncharacterized protein CI109_003896 [Kwoniella shandongensis]KAA5527637.1 hypothetical protein CI109_003896 [Kwoniella shandongensis]